MQFPSGSERMIMNTFISHDFNNCSLSIKLNTEKEVYICIDPLLELIDDL